MTQVQFSDLKSSALVETAEIDWQSSPSSGVERKYLERDTRGEVARATTLVRFAPNSSFPEHVHALGEEFFVLEGVFSDETGDFPAGTYVRNPPNSRHAPSSKLGCVILVKLRQMNLDDQERVVVDTTTASWQVEGYLESLLLFRSPRSEEYVRLERWKPQFAERRQSPGGLEFLVLEGSCTDGETSFQKGTWARFPAGDERTWTTSEGCVLWMKSGHLS